MTLIVKSFASSIAINENRHDCCNKDIIVNIYIAQMFFRSLILKHFRYKVFFFQYD